MLKIFFVAFFIAELIIALAIILKIYQFNKCVKVLSNIVLTNKNKLSLGLVDFRFFLEELTDTLLQLKEFVRIKRREYIFKTIKTSLYSFTFFLLKGKYKKAFLAYELVKEIYESYDEF